MHKIILLTIIIIVVIISLINASPLTVTDATIDRSGYHRYSVNGAGCTNMVSYITLEDPENTILSNFQFYNVDITTSIATPTVMVKTSTNAKALFRISLELPGGFGPFDLIATNGIVNKTISMNMTCIEPLKDQMQILDKTEIHSSIFGYSSFKFKVGGLQYPFVDANWLGLNSFPYLIGDSYMMCRLSSTSSLSIPSQIGINLQIGTEGIVPIFSDNNYKPDNIEYITDFTLYPSSSVQNIELMGNLYAPVYTWKSNTTYYAPSYRARIGTYLNTEYIFRPISTEGSITKYIGFVDYRGFNDVLTQYGFYAQNQTENTLREQFSFQIKAEPFESPIVGTLSVTGKILNIDFQSSDAYYYSPIFIIYSEFSVSNFPFGYKIGTNKLGYTFSANQLLPTFNVYPLWCYIYKNPVNFQGGIDSQISSPTQPDPQLIQFTVGAHNITHLYDNMFVLSIQISYYYPIYKFKIGNQVFGLETLVSGNEYNGVFDLVLNSISKWDYLIVNDIFSQQIPLNENGFYSFDYPPIVKPYTNFNYNDIKNVSILYKTMNVTNQVAYNILYFNYTNIDINTPISFIANGPAIYYTVSSAISIITEDLYDSMFHAYWNSTIQMFQVEFSLPKNSQPGIVPFALIFEYNRWVLSGDMGNNAQFTVISNNADLYGPIFTRIVKYPSSSVQVSTNPVSFGWSLTIDDASGFRDGFIKVRGVDDGSEYNFPLIATSNIYSDQYSIDLSVISNCFSQDYVISDVTLYDIENNNSTFSITLDYNSLAKSLYNPFINYLNDSNINRISIVCDSSTPDSSPPTIISLTSSVQTINVGGSVADRTIQFSMVAQDLDSGLKPNHYPTIYLTSVNFLTIQCDPLAIIENDPKSNEYLYSVTVPVGFGYPFGIILSVYGLVNNGGYYGGYSNTDLLTATSQTTISTVYTIVKPYISGSSRVSTEGGELWITGAGLKNVISAYYILNSKYSPLTIESYVSGSAIKLSNIPASETPFSIKVSTSTTESNIYSVTPFKRVELNPPTPTQSVLPTTPSIPTNKPQKCLNECGGSSQGYCSNSGCICISPWIGIDCSSKVIIVSPPTKNITNPSTEIPIFDQEYDDKSNYLFKSLISIVSLRELDFQNNIEKKHTFDKWVYSPIDEFTSKYFTNITVISKIDNTQSITGITVVLQWFKEETNITFANTQLVMQPSSIKYTIELSSYKFENSLNTLQFVMMASFESSKTNDICSTFEFGETSSGDNSNYIKIQIDNKSLYGRFIKRAIVDSTETSITNIALDSSFNAIKEPSTLQSYIGINVPHFKSSLIIDPDFSVLLNNNHASNNDNNSICQNSKSSSLSTTQLIGIIIGSVGFVICAVIIATVIFIKKRKHVLLLLKIKEIKMYKK